MFKEFNVKYSLVPIVVAMCTSLVLIYGKTIIPDSLLFWLQPEPLYAIIVEVVLTLLVLRLRLSIYLVIWLIWVLLVSIITALWPTIITPDNWRTLLLVVSFIFIIDMLSLAGVMIIIIMIEIPKEITPLDKI